MTSVYLMVDAEKNVIAIYDDADLAIKMHKSVEDKLQIKVTIEKRSVNIDIKMVGVIK